MRSLTRSDDDVCPVTTPYRPDLLVRAARHYEGAGQVLLRQAVMSSQRFISIGQGEVPPLGEWQEVECPARLDLAGESTENKNHFLCFHFVYL